MKKNIILFAFAIATLSTVSCKDEKKAENTTEVTTAEHDDHDDHEEGALHASYVCPMDCEKGKTYEAAGKCAVCEMDLIENSKEEAHTEDENHEDHSH